ncbi:MAG: phytoene desaturase family protein [Acidobacteriota bacterium]|nr:phytoene desaturase family protein [Acidobacteriota bacterium]
MSRQVIVVGAGPGGLTAAALLANAGMRVTVLERLPHLGGRTSNFVADGFRFDHGPTFFHYPQVLESILDSIGYDLWHELKLIQLDPQYRLVFGAGGEILASPNVQRMEAAISRLNAMDATQLRRFLRDNRDKLEKFKPFLETSFDSWRDTIKPKLLQLLPILKPWRSLDSELGRYFSDQRIRLAFSFQSKYLGMSPFECPSLFTILAFLEYEYGVYHPVGGCGSVTTALGRICERLGVKIRLNEPAQEILVQGQRATGIRTSAGEYKSDAIVINADFARAMSRLVPNHLRRRWKDHKLEKKSLSCSAFMMYLGLRGRYDHVSHHTIYVSKDYMGNMQDIGHKHVLSDDPSYYVQNASVTDRTLAPPGKSTLYILVPVTHQTKAVDWEREKPRFRELVLGKLSDIGIDDVRSRIEYERIITPANWDTDFELHKGAVFGLAHNWSQMLHLRPRNRFDELDGVYLVGGSTHPGSGLPVIFESARISSRLLLNDFGERIPWDSPRAKSLVAGVA